MQHSPRRSTSKFLVGLGIVMMSQVGWVLPSLGQYQGNEGDVVVIGESPSEWARFRAYWQGLLQLNPSAPPGNPESSSDVAANAPDPAELEAKIKKNLVVSGLNLKSILRLSGSSQVIGTITNKNPESVTVTSVAFEIVDEDGELVRTGAATPQPSTIGPGKSVTFSTDLFGFPARSSYEIRLADSPFVVRGGV